MTNSKSRDVLAQFETFLRTMSKEEFARLMNEYMAESNHNSWDGTPSRELAPMSRLFEDIMTYHRNIDDPDHFKKEWSNGSITY